MDGPESLSARGGKEVQLYQFKEFTPLKRDEV
jgi:hypothetical protein